MVKAIFIDFYGTVVHEDGTIIKTVSKKIYDTGTVDDLKYIGTYWWKVFQKLFSESFGENFDTQRALERKSLEDTITHFNSTADAEELSALMFEHWVKPPIFEESKEFFKKSMVPIYIVSNIDKADIIKAIDYHKLVPAGVFTSEDAKSYKPRRELFELALNKTELQPEEVVHIGDSISSDVKGASAIGINTLWLNRSNREIPDGVAAISNLLEAFSTEYFTD